MLRSELEPLGFAVRWADESGADRANAFEIHRPAVLLDPAAEHCDGPRLL
jgi:hypothetical protein